MTEERRDPTLIFGTASLLNDASTDMIAPIWPTFLSNILLLNVFQISVIDGLALTVASLSKIGSGYISDRTGKRKAFITAGYFMAMLSRLGFIISRTFYHIVFWKTLDRLGKMRGPPRDAIVADHAGENKRGSAFGVLRAMDSAGAVVGSIITYFLFSFLLWWFADPAMAYYTIILFSTIPAIGSVIIIAVLIKEKRGKDVFKGISFRGLNRDLKLFLVASVVFALATMSYSFLILFSGGFGYTETQLPLLYILFTIVYSLSAYPFGRASDKLGRKPILMIAFIMLIFTSLWAMIVNDMISVIPLFVFFGLSAGALDPVQTSLISDLVEQERRASIIGAFQMSVGISALPAGIFIGYFWYTFGAIAAFQYSLILALIAIILLAFVKPNVRHP